jgi:hypothetical protein
LKLKIEFFGKKKKMSILLKNEILSKFDIEFLLKSGYKSDLGLLLYFMILNGKSKDIEYIIAEKKYNEFKEDLFSKRYIFIDDENLMMKYQAVLDIVYTVFNNI